MQVLAFKTYCTSNSCSMLSHMYVQYTIQWNLLLYKLLWTSEGPLDCKYTNSTPSAHKRALRVFRNHAVDSSAPPTLFTPSESTISATPPSIKLCSLQYLSPLHTQPKPQDRTPTTPSATVTTVTGLNISVVLKQLLKLPSSLSTVYWSFFTIHSFTHTCN